MKRQIEQICNLILLNLIWFLLKIIFFPHVSLEVLKLWEEKNIKCTCLPPSPWTPPQHNSFTTTFRHSILWTFETKLEINIDKMERIYGRMCARIPKGKLSGLLKCLMDEIIPNKDKYLILGFKNLISGLYQLAKIEQLS